MKNVLLAAKAVRDERQIDARLLTYLPYAGRVVALLREQAFSLPAECAFLRRFYRVAAEAPPHIHLNLCGGTAGHAGAAEQQIHIAF